MQEIASWGQRKIGILVFNGFNHEELFGLQALFCQSKCPIYLIGLVGEPIYSSSGIAITADYIIDQLKKDDYFNNFLLIIFGDLAYTNHLLMDARVYRFILTILNHGSLVAATRQASEAVITTYQFLLPCNKSLLFQNKRTLENFVSYLLSLP